MKKLLLFLLVSGVMFNTVFADEAPRGWLTGLAEAEAKAEQMNLPILILVSGPEWCGPCRALHKKVIEDKGFNKIVQKHAVCLYLHQPFKTDPETQTAKDIEECSRRKYFTSGGVPRYVIVSPDKKKLGSPKRRTIADFTQAIADAKKEMGLPENAELTKFIARAQKEQARKDKELKKQMEKSRKKRKRK